MRYLEFQKYMDYYQNTIYSALRKTLKSKVSLKSKYLHMLKKINLNSSLIILISKWVQY